MHDEIRGNRKQRNRDIQHAAARASVAGPKGFNLMRLARPAIAIACLFGAVILLRDRVETLDATAIRDALVTVTPLQWAVALGATFLSFAALAQYDALIHRALGTGADPERARRAGWSAIAISQVLGFGMISGALVRWRMLPGTSLVETSKLTATVAASFLAAWAVLSAGALFFVPGTVPGLHPVAVTGLAVLALGLGGALAIAAFLHPELRLGKVVLRMPALPVMSRILWLAAVDTGFAALALWALLPNGAPLPLGTLYAAFLLALGAGFVSGTPGGVGPFEMALLLLLPAADEASLLAAVLAWRAVYYGLPAALAMIVIARPQRRRGAVVPEPRSAQMIGPGETRPTALNWALETAPAETGLLAQGEHGLLFDAELHSGWMVGRSGQVLAGVLDPFGPRPSHRALLGALTTQATSEGLTPCLYKVGSRTAVLARNAGWHVAPVAQEIWIDTARFTLDTPERSGLRRKLRRATKTGLSVSECTPEALPMDELIALNSAWIDARGSERGFSMGRFTPAYVATQRVFVARLEGRAVAFASFHAGAREWVLDLMRPAPDAPDGTMQALIIAAVEAARDAGAPELSLAALPPEAASHRGPAAAIWRQAARGKAAAGLRQFKIGFAPQARPLYIAAPSRPALVLAAADLARAIHRPAPLSEDRTAASQGVSTVEQIMTDGLETTATVHELRAARTDRAA